MYLFVAYLNRNIDYYIKQSDACITAVFIAMANSQHLSPERLLTDNKGVKMYSEYNKISRNQLAPI